MNTSGASLPCVSIGTDEPIEIRESADSGKFLVGAPNFHTIGRKGGQPDYWDGET